MAAHALLSASGAYRWSSCTPSARFEERFPDSQSLYALEGTIAHAIGEWALKYDRDCEELLEYFQEGDTRALVALIPEIADLEKVHGDQWPDELPAMLRYVQKYVDYVNAMPGEKLIEKQVDFSHVVPEGFGTSDAIILHNKVVDIVDLKYGKGIKVFADGPQAKLYAIGAIKDYDYIFEGVENVRLHIVQPRLDHVDVHEMTIAELGKFAFEIMEKADKAFKGEGEFVPGEHCGFCRGKAVCKARADYNIKLAMEEFGMATPPGNALTLEQIAGIMPQLDQIAKWVEEIKAYALEQALAGHEVPGYKVVEGRSTRKWIDENQVVEAMRKDGLSNEQIYTMKLIGITEAEKLLGKKSSVFDLTEKAPGKPAIVPVADKRMPLNLSTAATDFA